MTLKESTRIQLLARLKNLKEGMIPLPRRGICQVLYGIDEEEEATDEMSAAFRQWPGFSGSCLYPLPGGMEAYMGAAYPGGAAGDSKLPTEAWDASKPYGQARYRLLDFLIDHFSKRQGL